MINPWLKHFLQHNKLMYKEVSVNIGCDLNIRQSDLIAVPSYESISSFCQTWHKNFELHIYLKVKKKFE